MKRSSKIISAIVLSISLVTAAGAYATYKNGYDEAKASFIVSYVTGELELNNQQQQQLEELATKVLSLKSQFKDSAKPLHAEVKKMITEDSFNQQQALNMINEKTALINSSAPEVVSAFADFLDGLSDTQKSQVLEFLEKKGKHSGHH